MLLFLIACAFDSVSGVGELGRLRYTMVADTYFTEGAIDEIGIATGYTHDIRLSLTEAGQDRIHDRAEQLVQHISPVNGAVLEQEQNDDDDDGENDWDAEDVLLAVPDAGVHTLEAEWNEDLFDRIDLDFRTPVALELIGFVRQPWEEEFVRVEDEVAQVEKGAQYAWLTVSQDADGERLAGEVSPEMTAAPLSAVVPGMDVSSLNEDGIRSGDQPTLYFIESGAVTVTLADPVNGLVVTQAFEVGDGG